MNCLRSIASFIHMLSLPKPDYEKYCREKRIERHERYGGRIRFLRLHSVAHNILIPLMKAELYITGRRLTVIRNDRKKTDRPIIFCPTHIGGLDIEMSFLSIKTPCWLVLGDPRELYKSLDGLMLQLNGVIVMDVLEKSDRIVAKAQMEALLNSGGNLLLFPEGAQNVTPNALLNHLYAGAVDLAITYNAEIVPIAVYRDIDHYYVSLGDNITYDGCSYQDRFELTNVLRDRMATLLWEIMELFPAQKRSELSASAYDDFVDSILSFNTDYSWTVDDIEKGLFQPKGIIKPAEAFSHLKRLNADMRNAFLFNKFLHGYDFHS